MSYDNAEPKVLKTLNSDGQVLDDVGNVINDTSDYWVQLYNQTEPKVDKILKSDGTIVDSAGNLIQDTTEFNVQKYNQAEPIPAKYLHSDGTIDENPGTGSADLEDNHQTTIDVSTYTQPVEVTPTSGKDGMKKNTVTLTNIPSGGAGNIYCDFNAPMESDIVPVGEYVGIQVFDPDLGYRLYTIAGDGVKTVGDLLTEIAGSGYAWIYVVSCTDVTVNEESVPIGKLHLYYGYAG